MTEIEKKKQKFKEKFKTGIPLDDDIFMFFAMDKMFCQEFLRVILEDDTLEVLENDIQKHLPNVYFKSAKIDLLCKLVDKRIVNVEINLYKESDNPKRLFHYATMIRETIVDKGTKYGDINDIIIIYLTKDDILGLGSTVYNVEMKVVSDQGQYVKDWDCGLKVMYVNTVGLTNKNINEYLKLLTDRVTINEKYKETMRLKEDIIKKEDKRMSTLFREILEDERAQKI